MVMSLKLHPTLFARRCDDNTKSFTLPTWAAKSVEIGAALHIIKHGSTLDTLRLDEHVYYLFGRNPICPCKAGSTVTLDHPTVSRQHAAIVHADNGAVFLIDLGSAHGTFYAGKKVEPFVPVLLENGRVISVGMSTRRYLVRLFPTKQSVLGNPSKCYSLPLSTGDTVSTDKQTELHTGINCLLSCLPDEQKSLNLSQSMRHRGRTRGHSMALDFMDCMADKPPKLMKCRRVSFSPEEPEIIPMHERKSNSMLASKACQSTNVSKTIETFLGNCNQASFQVFLDATGLDESRETFEKLNCGRQPLTPNSMNTMHCREPTWRRPKSASFAYGTSNLNHTDNQNKWTSARISTEPKRLVNRRRTCSEVHMISPMFGNDSGLVGRKCKRMKMKMDMRVATPVE